MVQRITVVLIIFSAVVVVVGVVVALLFSGRNDKIRMAIRCVVLRLLATFLLSCCVMLSENIHMKFLCSFAFLFRRTTLLPLHFSHYSRLAGALFVPFFRSRRISTWKWSTTVFLILFLVAFVQGEPATLRMI